MKSLLLKNFTTIKTGGPANNVLLPETEKDFVEVLKNLVTQKVAFLVVGGGSNLLVADSGYAGTVVHPKTRGYKIVADASQYQLLQIQAGERFDDFISQTVEQNLSGLEMLSGIPGFVGAVPIQNVGAYGCEVAETIYSVGCWDRQKQQLVTFFNSELGFSYRNSMLKAQKFRYIVLHVTFKLYKTQLSKTIQYAELAKYLTVPLGKRVPVDKVRQAVLLLRASKGMVFDVADYDSWSLGSFFVNPLVDFGFAQSLVSTAPKFVQSDGRVKLSAAWLIENAGFGKGYGISGAGFALTQGRVGLSTKHVLAITNRGQASTEDVLVLARVVQGGVLRKFGVLLVVEPVLLGCSV